ncbi:neutral/alkaline non-lysosomal ceramidase N-terminal domain-containing protein [Gracilibacillus sp. HCP3S3_G5_1]|uniref:neutral/alkaline non-lysosomal ceramidase N-terminal domain-containing protein n=1 Tax=unclassified Gracilibacillus TaxID=2625209 RepID=UPI003F89BE2D
MRLGASKRDITPSEAINLAGFAHRQGKTNTVQEKIYVKAFVLEFCHKAFLFIVADLIWWDNRQVETLKLEIQNKFNIPTDYICFHATHNHSGPQTSSRFSKKLGKRSHSYLEFLHTQVIQSVINALDNKEEVIVKVNRGSVPIGINRRSMVNGEVRMAPDERGGVDHEVSVFSFYTTKGKAKAIWIHYTCHPTSTDANVVSSEYPGYCCKQVETKYPGTHVAFLQGFCGDIRPALMKKGNFYRGTLEDMACIGDMLANEVTKLLDQEGEVCHPEHITVKVTKLPLVFNTEEVHNKIPQDLAKEWPTLVQQIDGHYELFIQYVQLGSHLKLLCCNAELVHEYGKMIKGINKDILPLGYSNGMVGYVPTAKQLMEGGYEAEESLYYFGYPAKLSASFENDLVKQLEQCVKGGI